MKPDEENPHAVKIIPSMEVRWFFKDEPASLSLRQWFAAAFPNLKPEDLREDWYLCFPDITFSGVKLRPYQGPPATLNLEFKLRDCHGPVTFAQGVVGSMENWRKWTASIDMDAEAYMRNVAGTKPWTLIKKNRTLATFRVSNGIVELLTEKKYLDQGCGLELTHLRTGTGENWWTLGLEAFSTRAGSDLAMILFQTATHVFKQMPAVPLGTQNSFSYPEWVAQISGKAPK